jgi:hypothetical protein
MNARQRAIFGKLDSAFANERAIALEQLVNSGFKFRTEFEAAETGGAEATEALARQNAALDAELTEWKAAVGEWQKYSEKLKGDLAAATLAAGRRQQSGKRLQARRAGGWALIVFAAVLVGSLAAAHRPASPEPACASGRVVHEAGGDLHWEPPHCGDLPPSGTRHTPRRGHRGRAALPHPSDN